MRTPLALLLLASLPLTSHAVPLRLRSNKPIVQVRVNHSEPQWFILDSGCRGTSILAFDAADRLGVARTQGETGDVGAGSGTKVQLAQARDPLFLEALGETLTVGEPIVMTLGHVAKLEGQQVDGLLGGDFFARHVITLDYARNDIALEDPATYTPPAGAIVIPVDLDTGWPVARGSVTTADGRTLPCNFLVDTGVRFTLALFRPFCERNELRGSGTLKGAVVGYGVGGASRGDVSRMTALSLGGFEVRKPVVIYSRDTTGVFAMDGPDGIIGGELLKRARTTFDYPHGRLVLEPYKTAETAFEFDMSGLFLTTDPPAYEAIRVLAINPGTPAAAADLRVGDQIVSIDGKALSLDETRARLRVPGVRRIALKRDGKPIQVKLEVQRLV
jgi:hypothetical protein